MKLLRNSPRKLSKWEMVTVAGPYLPHVSPVSGMRALSHCICLRIFRVGIKPAAWEGHPLCLSTLPARKKCSEKAVSHPGPAWVPGETLREFQRPGGNKFPLYFSQMNATSSSKGNAVRAKLDILYFLGHSFTFLTAFLRYNCLTCKMYNIYFDTCTYPWNHHYHQLCRHIYCPL